MTYGELKTLTSVLLIGDTKLPDDTSVLALVRLNLYNIAMEAEALSLITNTLDSKTIRKATPKGLYVRRPEDPVDDGDVIDLDYELSFALAQYIASQLSKAKASTFKQDARQIITNYNTKVYDVLNDVEFNYDTMKAEL